MNGFNGVKKLLYPLTTSIKGERNCLSYIYYTSRHKAKLGMYWEEEYSVSKFNMVSLSWRGIN